MDGIIRERSRAQECSKQRGWNQRVGGEPIGLRLDLLHLRVDHPVRQVFIGVIHDEGALAPVQQYVRDFMEEREPELVVPLVP